MVTPLATSIVDLLLSSTLAPAEPRSGNRVSIEGIEWSTSEQGAFEVRVRRLEAAGLRLASGPHLLEVGRLAVDTLAASLRFESGQAHLASLEFASAELSDVKVRGPLDLMAQAAAHAANAPAWSLGPLGSADGTIRAEIVDAHLMFDADVTLPIQSGNIDFKDATVEHIGLDSRMGVSHLGLYVDAPNGRGYLYQFSSPPTAGVTYEQRGALLGPFGSNRGSLQLQPFAEWMLRQPVSGHIMGVTEQARLLSDRTAVSGEVQLGDGRFTTPHGQAEFVGRDDGHNVARLHSQAVGRGIAVELAALSLRSAMLDVGGLRLDCGEVTGALTLRVVVEGGQLGLSCSAANLKAAGVRVHVERMRA